MLELLHANPWRPPDARWQRAGGILNGDMDATPRRDTGEGCRWIKRAQRFRSSYNDARDPRDKMGVLTKYPDIYWANHLYEQSLTNDRALRWGIEARLLARETDREIAIKAGCREDAIKAYEALFFCVRDRIDNTDYILNSVLGQAVVRGLQAREHDLLWKLFGYLAGPFVLDAMISHFPNPMWAHRPDDVPAFFQDAAINLMKKKAAIASLAVPVEGGTQLHLIEAFVKYVEIERTTDSLGNAQDQIQENLQGILNGLPYQAVGKATVSKLPMYQQGSVELRTDEMLLTAIGLQTPEIESLQTLSYPEAK